MRRLGLLVACILVLGTGSNLLAQAPPEARLADLQVLVAELRQRIADLEAENAQLRQQLASEQRTAADLAAERTQLEKLAGVTSKGEAVESEAALIESRYDAQRDVTRVIVKPRAIGTTSPGPFSVEHRIGLAYEYPGQAMQQPPSVVQLLIYTFQHPTNVYAHLDSMTFTLDGEPAQAPVAAYEVLKRRRSAPSLRMKKRVELYDERLTLTLDTDTLRRLAAATSAVLHLPGNDLLFERQHLAMAAAIRERINRGL